MHIDNTTVHIKYGGLTSDPEIGFYETKLHAFDERIQDASCSACAG